MFLLKVRDIETIENVTKNNILKKNELFYFRIVYEDVRIKTMKEKCTKYEALFTFGDEEQLKKHIAECEDCQKEAQMMEKISDLIQEVKPHYQKKRDFWVKVKVACVLFVIILCGSTSLIGTNQDMMDTLKYGTTLSAEDLGLPVDSYGLIMVE